MARTAVTKKAQARYQDTLASDETRIDFAASDAVNKNKIANWNGTELIFAKNVHASAAKNYIVTSVADSEGRTGDLTVALAAGETALLPPLSFQGFKQSTGELYLEGEDANIHFACITPRQN